jgi:hypothetical protein
MAAHCRNRECGSMTSLGMITLLARVGTGGDGCPGGRA